MTRAVLLSCGLLSSLLYVGIDISGALSSPGYSYANHAISEMSAVDAPTRPLLAPFYLLYTLLFFPFAAGVWISVPRGDRLRISAICLLAVGLLGFAWPYFPMHLRGAERDFRDTMHLVLSGLDVLLLMTAIGAGATAFGRKFRRYSIATIAVMLLFGAMTALDAPRLDAGLPTPWLGLKERISIAAYLLWIAVLSVALLRRKGFGQANGWAVRPASTAGVSAAGAWQS